MPDLRAMKADVAAFADAIGQPLASWQAEALRFESRVTCVLAGRQMGKSRALALTALWAAFRARERRSLVISASEDAARRLLGECRRIAQSSDLLSGGVVDEQGGLLRLTNGSEVRSVAASERAVRGWSVDALLIDEACLLPAALVMPAAIPTTTARPQALILLASTASAAAGPFFDLVRLGEVGSEHVRAFRWVSRVAGGACDAPWISASAIEADRPTMHPLRFDAEHRATFAGSADSLFSLRTIEAATVDFVPDELGLMRGPARVLGGVDWGASVDRSAFVGIGRLAIPGERVFAVRSVRRWEAGAALHAVAGEIASSPAHFSALSSEVNGLGAAATEILWRAIVGRPFDSGGGRPAPSVVLVDEDPLATPRRPRPVRRAGFVTQRRNVVTSAGLKAGAWSAVQLLFGQGDFWVPAAERELLSELRLLKVDLTPSTGVERIEASSGHDDLADGLMLASGAFRRADGRWSTLLGEMAQRRDLPDGFVPLAVVRSSRVDGPGGRSVPRRPAWVSVAGDEVTLPAGLDLTDPVLRDVRERVTAALKTRHEEAG
jgi:hypothetical protein